MKAFNLSMALTMGLFMCILCSSAFADTLIYDNSNLNYSGFNGYDGWYLQEFLDYGSSSGGLLSKFVFDYWTESSTTGTIWITFYSYTDYYDPGYWTKTFVLTNVPSTGGYIDTYEYIIPEEDRFELPAGDFGYSFLLSRSTTYIATASGGQGNEDWFWIWNDNYDDFVRTYFSTGWSGFSMQVYTLPPVDEMTCDIFGRKFEDADGNGQWDAGEPGLPGWEFYIDQNDDGVYQASEPNTVTDPNGLYFFENLEFDTPGDPNEQKSFIIREIARDGWIQTVPGGPDYAHTLIAEPNNIYGPCDFGNQVFSGLTQTLYPVADAYVSNTEPDTNFGTSYNLFAGKSGSAVYRAFLKFDMTQIPEGYEIISAILEVQGSYIPAAAVTVGAWQTSEAWNESEITWNNQKTAYDTSPADTCVIAIGTNQWDVTRDADDTYCYDRELSILLQSTNESLAYYTGFWSREFTGYSPRLVVQYAPLFGGGTGTPEDPYQIWTPEQMNSIATYANRLDRCYKLMADISMAAFQGSAYNQIGTWSSTVSQRVPFKGVFDGNGHTISNFKAGALFDYVNPGRIQNLGLIAPVVSDNGAIVDRMEWSDIANCWISGGSVSGSDDTGGLVGTLYLSNVGGCWSSATVSGADYVGGLIGFASGFVQIQNSYALGNVSGDNHIGGFIGGVYNSVLSDCYSAGSVSGTSGLGGFCGYAENYFPHDTAFQCFWDSQASGVPSSALGTPASTAQMKTLGTFTGAGWDFVSETVNGRNDDWAIQTGSYPILSYQLASPPLPVFAGGNGTEASPYLIETVDQLNSIGHNRALMDKHFRLSNNLDLAGQSFAMIADSAYAFTGRFDGDSHVIKNISIDIPVFSNNVGFIGSNCGGRVENLTLRNLTLQAEYARNVGGLMGYNRTGTARNCHIQNADTTGFLTIGGLVGLNYWHALISRCSVIGRVEESGLWGYTMSPAGGIVGENSWWSQIEYTGANVDVVGQEFLGGLVGNNTIYARLEDCYGIGTVSADGSQTYVYAGGLAGKTAGANRFTRCYAASEIIAPEGSLRIGVMAGAEQSGTYTDCFWDNEINGSLSGFGSTNTSTVFIDTVGRTTADMQTALTYQSQGWDFENTWRLCEGMNYPRLKYEPSMPADFSCPEGIELYDLIFLSEQWLTLAPDLTADIAPDGGDGQVNMLDFALFAENWMLGTD